MLKHEVLSGGKLLYSRSENDWVSFHLKAVDDYEDTKYLREIYFYDLGLRNFFMDNFESFKQRDDQGGLLENAVFRQLIKVHDDLFLRFWRTVQQNEVDFIIKEKRALEVKVNLRRFKESVYQTFLQNYPEIDFSLVTLDKQEDEFKGYKVLDVWQV